MRFLLFILIEIVLLPFQLIGIVMYLWKIIRKTNPAGISGTANEIVNARLLMHIAGTREDEATSKIVPYLPAYGHFVAWSIATIGYAARWSGFSFAWTKFPAKRPSTMQAMVSHRSEFFDKLLNNFCEQHSSGNNCQIVSLGSGFDTRPWGLLADKDARIFEVDKAPTQRAKIEAIKKSGLALDRVCFVESDFEEKSWLQSLVENGFDNALPTFVLWEGVTMYLTEDAVRSTLSTVSELAPGSQVAFDYFSTEMCRLEPPLEKIGKKMQQGIKVFANEGFGGFSLSTKVPAKDKAESFLNECGLKVIDFDYMGQEEAAYSAMVAGEAP